MYLTPDLTMQDPLYRKDNHIFLVITPDQKLKFNTAVFVDSLQLTMLGTINIPFAKDYDWTVQEDDIDYETMSKLKLKDPSFDKLVCNQITVVKPYASFEYKVSAVYQRVYPLQGKIALINDAPLEVTPDLIAYLLNNMEYLLGMLTPVRDLHAPTTTNQLGLEIDPYLERPENFIVGEEHIVNVPNKKPFIHPLGGSFGKGTLKITNLNTDTLMVEGVDYTVFGAQHHKTKLSSHTPGIYEYILFLNSYVGKVSIDYHAFGGDVTITDHRELLEKLNNILGFIQQSQFVTYDNLKNAPIMANLYSQFLQLKGDIKNMRSLLSGRPSGIDISNGSVMKKRLVSSDSKFHWWNIATLYKVDGSSDIVTADVLKIRLRTDLTCFMFEAIIAVNLNAPNNKMNVQTLVPVYPMGYVPYQDYSQLNYIIRPQFRCIWNTNTAQGSGVTLQLGLALKTVVEDTLVIENWSGQESCWMLEPSNLTGDYPSDNVINLPAENHIWDSANPDSRQETLLCPFDDGHLIWAGAVPLNVASGTQHFTLSHLLESNVDISRIKKMSFELSEQPKGQYCVIANFVPGFDELTGSASFDYNGKPAYLTGSLTKLPGGKVRLVVSSNITAGIAANRLDLRHVKIFT